MNGTKKRTSTGFSLFEVIVTMTIIAIFLAAATNVFTKRYKKRVSVHTHGRIECYYNKNGELWQREFTGSRKTYDGRAKDEDGNENDSYCAFTPSKSSAYLVINTAGGGGGGGGTYGGSAGGYENTFVNVTTHKLRLYPGKGGAESADGEDSYVEQADDSDDFDSIIEAEGGRGDSGSNYYITDCSVSYTKYSCSNARCTVDNDDRKVTVRYGRTATACNNSNYTTETFKFDTVKEAAASVEEEDDDIDLSDVMLTYNYSDDDDYGNTILYFTIAFRLDGNFTEEREESGLEKYIAGLDIHDGIGSYDPDDDDDDGSDENSESDVWEGFSPGSGGAPGEAGGTGAVLIVW